MKQQYVPSFYITNESTLFSRLAAQIRSTISEISTGPASYLRTVFLPDENKTWFPVKLAREIAFTVLMVLTHPLQFLRETFTPDFAGKKWVRRFYPLLAISMFIHGIFIGYIIYAALISPFSSFRLVHKPYKPFDEAMMLKQLHYPSQMLRGMTQGRIMTLDELHESDKKRAAELEKRKREEAEKEAAKKAAEEAGRDEEDKSFDPSETKFGEINEAPIKDIIGQVYTQYREGQLDLSIINFTVMATFKIERDGSLSNIELVEKSGSRIIDRQALAILYAISESHALSPLSDLSSDSIKFELAETYAQVTITGFAPSASDARAKATVLNDVLMLARLAQIKKNPDAAELLGILKISCDNNRVSAVMNVPRSRAGQMMHARFDKKAATSFQ